MAGNAVLWLSRQNNPENMWLTSRKSARSDVWSVASTNRFSPSSCCYQSYVRYISQTANVSLSWTKHLCQQKRRYLVNTVIIYIVCTRLSKSSTGTASCEMFFPSTHLLQFTQNSNLLYQNNKPVWGVKVHLVCTGKSLPAARSTYPRRKVPNTKAATVVKIKSCTVAHILLKTLLFSICKVQYESTKLAFFLSRKI